MEVYCPWNKGGFYPQLNDIKTGEAYKTFPWEIYTTSENCRSANLALFVQETLCEKDQMLFAAW